MHNLTPRDRGDFPQPHPWPLRGEDHNGVIDFDDKKTGTIFSVLAKSLGDGHGHLLSVNAYPSTSTWLIEVNGNYMVALDEVMLASIQELADLAQHGFDIFRDQTDRGEVSEAVVAESNQRWARANTALNTVRHTIDAAERRKSEPNI